MKTSSKKKCMFFSIRMFRVLGCWPRWNKKHQRKEKLYYLYTTFVYGVLVAYALILFYGLKVFYKTWDSMDEMIEDFVVLGTGFITVVKVFLILYNQSGLEEIVNRINFDLNETEVLEESEKDIIRACIKHERSLTKNYLLCGYCITTLYTVSSVIKILKQRSDDNKTYTLPLKYPFRPTGFPLYHLTYLHQMLSMIVIGHCGTLSDVFFSNLANYICGHLEILKNRISKEGINERFVLYHNKILRLKDKLQSVFDQFLMFQLTLTSVMVCLGLAQITQTETINTIHYFKCLIYLSIKMAQLFLYCYYGQKIIDKSSAICNEAYFGSWYIEMDNKKLSDNTKMIIFRTQKALMIKGGNFFTVSLPTLATVVQRSYSFFTLLTSSRG